ncbi:TetR/AcrR family transcriptional regulator [Endozoicomonadaceae bacterium StTr2]
MSALPAEKPEADTVIPSAVTSITKGRRHQTRSLERRRRILTAARELVTSESVSSLSLYDVARKAEIPPSSLYHFFPRMDVLLQALAEEAFEAFDSCVAEPIPADQIDHWSDIGQILESRMQQYYQDNPMARALILGQHLHSDILSADHQHDEQMGKQIEAIYRSFFELPPLPQSYNIFAIALQIADKVYAMSHQEYGNITPELAREGWRAARSYLSIYLPDQLQRSL